ncbi:exodeoxyribonuclease V subunit beta [Desulfobacula sp.]|uniref:exodeoxyribonuclease V subunit beta n=1 Tax=Desulfobacula sp. TaxID=2593537 RepID=UPI0026139F2E|nr:exodeoxyribonuclease V subunit beta [Desulfobacula sp.]
MKPLDPFHIDLEKTTLIEASAGTGKTYTITTLYCRLVAKGYPVESILVVTFTEAAAAELKLRIRTRLFNTFVMLSEQSYDSEDDLARFFSRDKDLSLICQRLRLALTCFDQASIMTIHSFCLKVLKENAFESHSLFDIELVPDRSLFLRQVSYDFFMGHVNNLDKLFLSYLTQRQITPESFAASFGQVVSKPNIILKPPVATFENIFDDYRETLEKIYDILLTRTDEISELIQNHKGVDKRSYSKKNVPVWLDTSRLKLDQGMNILFKMTEKGDALYKFTQTRLELKTKPGQTPPEHEFFDLCEQLLSFYEVFENNLISLKIEFLAFFNTELDKMKKAYGICFFDDLVNDLAAALEKEDAQNLQKAVRQTYKACLIDEFQDTDPRQYDIFSKIFFSQGTPFFMIGDPKQAIYAFRGGDIFAYLKASKESDQKFTLEKNYRSAPLLVDGINETFSSSINPFLYDPIKFLKVTTPVTATNSLVENEQMVPPLQFGFIKRDDHALDRQGFISKETAAGIIPLAVAEDILSLLQSGKMLITNHSSDPQKISSKDIAVLVRTNKQAEQINAALSDLNIPSHLSKTGSVFESRQAIDLHDILWAVYNPDHKGSINAALCTSVFNFSSDMIVVLDKEEVLFFKWQDRFRAYKEIWEVKGFVSMAMALLHSDEAFLKTNLRLDERGLTNFYHLVELISQACLKQQLSPYYLLKWYGRQLFKDLRDEFEDELRLESDKKSVTIVTIHKSKGLEYPVVYLPYLWEGLRKPSYENILFHDSEKDHRLTLDLGSKDLTNSQDHFEKEEKAEQRRLLYVALTRASAMCRIIWGGFKSVDTSAFGTLLHPNGCKDDQSMISDLKQLRSTADQSILVQSHTPDSSGHLMDRTALPSPVLSAQKITREIKASWKMSSFSAITQSQHPEAFQGREKSDENRAGPLITLAQFPKGAGSGDLFHSVFETLDFTEGSGEISKLVQSKFDMFGFSDQELIQMGETSVKEVLETRLTTETSGFCLKDIQPDQRFNEMEFTFPVQSFQMSSVQKVFGRSDPKFKTSGYLKKLSQLTAQSFKGFMKGFIDLVIHHEGKWYIIDYKSNYLGDTYDQYSQDAMFDAMSDHHYFLQYHLYLVALHRYLTLRLKDYDYDTHFGGIFYLFIRGMHSDFGPRYGVFQDRPSKAVISYLSDNFYDR